MQKMKRIIQRIAEVIMAGGPRMLETEKTSRNMIKRKGGVIKAIFESICPLKIESLDAKLHKIGNTMII